MPKIFEPGQGSARPADNVWIAACAGIRRFGIRLAAIVVRFHSYGKGVSMKSVLVRCVCRMLIVCMGALPFGAHAGMVSTDEAAAAAQAQGSRDRLRVLLARSDVRGQLQEFGVSPAAAQARVSALTDAEAASLAGRIDSLPAGGTSGWAVAAGLLVIGLIWYYWVK